VTGRESRTRLEQFFSNATAQENSTNVTQTPSNLFRSSLIASELDELNSRQRVSNVLNTNTREEIERTLQRSRPQPNSVSNNGASTQLSEPTVVIPNSNIPER